MKKIIAILMCMVLMFGMCACGEKKETATETTTTETITETFKAGAILIGDENSAYDRNFLIAMDNATTILAEEGINVEWVYKYNLPEGDDVTVANEELAEEGCSIVFNNSYGQEPYMLIAAAEYPDTQFVGMTNEASTFDDLANTHNAFARIYEGRFLAGIVAGLKLQDMIANGVITEEQAIIGYVGAYPFAEVISGYTAYYLGAKTVCPSVTMKVNFVSSWSDPTLEAAAADALCNQGCVIISQHSDSTTPATTAQTYGVFHTGYNIDMSDVAPAASLVSTRIDWTNYFVYAIKAVANGEEFAQDYCTGLAEGDVVLTALNEVLVPEGTAEVVEKAMGQIIDGSLKVFDTEYFTVNGEKVEHAFALDTDGDYVNDSEEAIIDGEFKESYYKSAPYFALEIDGIEMLN